jgi:hypothetical protein
MEFSFTTLARVVMVGCDLAHAGAQSLFENRWYGGLSVLSLCLLLGLLKLPPLLLSAVVLFLMVGIVLLKALSFL